MQLEYYTPLIIQTQHQFTLILFFGALVDTSRISEASRLVIVGSNPPL